MLILCYFWVLPFLFSYLVFCIRRQDKIILKSLLLFSVFSFICALSVLMNSEILFIFDMVVTLIFAVVAVRSFDGMLKRLFIPFMSVFFSVLKGYLQLLADDFYISSRRITQNKDAVRHYSSKFYSSNFLKEQSLLMIYIS